VGCDKTLEEIRARASGLTNAYDCAKVWYLYRGRKEFQNGCI